MLKLNSNEYYQKVILNYWKKKDEKKYNLLIGLYAEIKERSTLWVDAPTLQFKIINELFDNKINITTYRYYMNHISANKMLNIIKINIEDVKISDIDKYSIIVVANLKRLYNYQHIYNNFLVIKEKIKLNNLLKGKL